MNLSSFQVFFTRITEPRSGCYSINVNGTRLMLTLVSVA